MESSFLQVWDFKSCKLKSRLDVGKSVTKIAYHRANGIVYVFIVFGYSHVYFIFRELTSICYLWQVFLQL